MATLHYTGNGLAVVQVDTASIDSVDGTPADNDFIVTIGGVAITQTGDTDVATTAAALVVLLAASTHPYFAAITWTNPSAGNIVATAKIAGVEFIATLTETGVGSGAITNFAVTTALAGPNVWSDGNNWKDASSGATGTAPAAADTAIIDDVTDNILWKLDQNSIDLTKIISRKSFTGKMGLNWSVFATTADGATVSTEAVEYRQTYLKIGYTKGEFGEHAGPTSSVPDGSARFKIHNSKSGASTTTVFGTGQSSDAGLAAFRFLASHANADIFVRNALGGVSIGGDLPGETCTIGDVVVSARGNSTQVITSDGVTLSNWSQTGGNNLMNAAAAVTAASITVDGGRLTTEGDWDATLMTVNGGQAFPNHEKSGGTAIVTVNLAGGQTDASGNDEPRTWGIVNLSGDGDLIKNDNLTITTLNEPTIKSTLSWSQD